MTPPSISPTTDPMLRAAISKYASALSSFQSSSSSFRILHSIPSSSLSTAPRTLYVLDSSFNPPTLAHQRIALSALLHDFQPSPSPKRLLLLLATQNADKAPKPAAFEQRLVMMQIFAEELLASLKTPSLSPDPRADANQSNGVGPHPLPSTDEEGVSIDIGVTTHPYFVDKSHSLGESSAYGESTQQIHLVGYDTLIRILNPSYYPPSNDLSSLQPFLAKHRLRVTYRDGGGWGEKESQDEYLRKIQEGKREGEAARREWVDEERIVLIEGRKQGEEVVSSTKVREAVQDGDKDVLARLVTKRVAEWIIEERLYLE